MECAEWHWVCTFGGGGGTQGQDSDSLAHDILKLEHCLSFPSAEELVVYHTHSNGALLFTVTGTPKALGL